MAPSAVLTPARVRGASRAGGGRPNLAAPVEVEVIMRKSFLTIALLLCWSWAIPLGAQQPCLGYSIVINTPEDQTILAVNGAENPQEQIDALDKFTQAHADSKFMPCAHEYYTIAYLKMNNYDKVIEHGEQALTANHQDVLLMLNVIKAYVGGGKVSDTAFDVVLKAPEQINTEANPPRPMDVNEENWQKNLQELGQSAKELRAYMAYAFFQLLPRVPDASKRLVLLDKFAQAFPDAATEHAKAINYQRFLAYKLAGDMTKVVESGEKVVAEDPGNVEVLNLLAYIYANQRTDLDKASGYAQKALDLATGMKKPEGVTDAQFASTQKLQQGMAHLTLGYIDFVKVEKTRKVGPALQELKTAVDLLDENPQLQAQALYYIGYAYETMYPANHTAAIEALSRAAGLQSSWQTQASDLLAKVKRAARK